MRWGRAVRAVCASGILGITCPAGAQEADDVEFNVLPSTVSTTSWSALFDPRLSKKKPFDYLSGGMPDRLMFFTGLDASHWSFGAYAGVQWAPSGLNREGFILRMFLSESIERYTTRLSNYDTQTSRASIMPGYLVRSGNLEVQVLAGVDLEADLFFVDTRPNKWRTRSGIRGTTDVWYEPTRELMLQFALSGTTIDNGYSTRLAAGWRLFDEFWIGPEATLSRDYFGQQTRIGGHLTGLRMGPYEWTFAAGRIQDNFDRSGIYARLGIMLRPPRRPFFEN